jgi:hypothetical protein
MTGAIGMFAQTAYKVDLEVQENGQLVIAVPFPSGAHVTVFIVEANDPFDDLLTASESSLDFWNNPYDDEDWTNA